LRSALRCSSSTRWPSYEDFHELDRSRARHEVAVEDFGEGGCDFRHFFDRCAASELALDRGYAGAASRTV
jgi:hypothetical protein